MVGIRSPNGLVVGSCTSHPIVLGSIPKREEPGKAGRHPVLKYRVPHGSHFKREAFYQFLKTKIGLAAAKAAVLRINLNIEGCGVVAPSLHAPSRARLLLPLLLSHNLPLPHIH
jgi:hypothetical protein